MEQKTVDPVIEAQMGDIDITKQVAVYKQEITESGRRSRIPPVQRAEATLHCQIRSSVVSRWLTVNGRPAKNKYTLSVTNV